MAAMARPARDRRTAALLLLLHLAQVVLVDLFRHLVHQPRRVLLRFGVIGKVQRWFPARGLPRRIRRMAGPALCSQRCGPSVHQLMHLVAGHILRQHFQVGRRGVRWMMMFRDSCRRWRVPRALGEGDDSKSCRQNRCRSNGQIRGSCLQFGNSSCAEVTSTLLTNLHDPELRFPPASADPTHAHAPAAQIAKANPPRV
jgi:hypothetical protein